MVEPDDQTVGAAAKDALDKSEGAASLRIWLTSLRELLSKEQAILLVGRIRQ